MARRPRGTRENSKTESPNLEAFMNIVVILIPMLLLSVVFMEVGVINVTLPLGGSATTDKPEEDEKEKLDLAIAISPNGFYITAAGAQRPAIDGCPTQGPTICLQDTSVDTQALFEEARQLMASDEAVRGEERMEEALRAYNFRGLYNMLSEFKRNFPDESTVRLTSDSDIPFALTIRVMDVSRYRLAEDSYQSDEEFWAASYRTETNDAGEEQPANLFGDPAFAVVQ